MYATEGQADYAEAAATTIMQIHIDESEGDILAFLTGREEIETIQRSLQDKAAQLPDTMPKLNVYPMFAALPSEEQIKVFAPSAPGSRKVILATNIAETSITINGIRYVVDPGFVKSKIFNAETGVDSLVVVPVSQAAARQRTGRAGREAPGKCYRLFTEDSFYELKESSLPEIRRANLASTVLQMKAIGLDPVRFDYIDPPQKDAVRRALENLVYLGAIASNNTLTEEGKRMSELPLDPSFAKVLLASKEYGCTEEVLTIVSLLSVEADSILYTPPRRAKEAALARKSFISEEGDHIMLLNIYRAFVQQGMSIDWCRDNFVNGRTLRKAKVRERHMVSDAVGC
eukprot:TRINITY_DN3852_c0_g1_i4.p1 TRINITY_DN3852_c0_g1~~TRINITY_DN3852_c0_g1_i4.p1  ORF type:complete len:344 (-),score=89.55 TRINITY_DN3852_c0_g1_i4:343-1374(-)